MLWFLVRQRRACRFQSKVIAATGCGVVMTDATTPHHPVTHVNPAFRLLTGYADNEILGKTTAILAGPGTDRASVEKLELALQHGRACRVCLLHYRKDGAPFLNEITLSPVKGRTGRVIAMVWVMIDVTRSQREEEQGKEGVDNEHEQATQFKLAVESAPCGMLMVGSDGLISMVNTRIEQMFGYTREELLGKPVEFLIPARHRPLHQVARSEFVSAPAVRPMGAGRELSGLRKDGSECPVEIGLNPVSMASGASVLATVIDITDQRLAERRLRESEERLDLAVRAAQIGVFEHDHRTDTIYWSPILRSIYGVSVDEPGLFQRYIELVHGSDREKVLSAVKEGHDPAGNGQFQVEHRIVRPDGEVRHISLHSFTWFDREGAAPVPGRTIGIVIDITDRKKVEASLRTAAKMAAISTLSGGIAHEFNNSLTAVLGFSHLALPLIPKDNKAHHYVQQVLSAGLESRDLVHQLLTFSRQSDHVRHPLPLHLLVKEALKPLRSAIPPSIDLKEQIDTSTSPVMADTAQMHQMIMNLVDNAIHAMRKTGGTLEFHLQDKEIETDHVTPTGRLVAGLYACLTVRDSGEGMEPAVADRIFEPFFSGKPLGEGRGMGLSIVHGIVTAHGGTVVINSQIDVGTVVSVYIPALSRPAVAVAPAPDDSLPRGHECILFVDAEESLALSGQEMLESLGYRPIVLRSGTAAWQAFHLAPQRVHLLIADLALPDMPGDRLAHRCRQLRPDLPVILCAGSDAGQSDREACVSGIAELAPKPLTLHDLAYRIRRVLDARSAAYPSSTQQLMQGEEQSPLPEEGLNAVSTRR